MYVFVVITEDRHCDVNVELFYTSTGAINYAKKIANDNVTDSKDVEEGMTKLMKERGFIYFARYSTEGDCVSVKKKKLNLVLGV